MTWHSMIRIQNTKISRPSCTSPVPQRPIPVVVDSYQGPPFSPELVGLSSVIQVNSIPTSVNSTPFYFLHTCSISIITTHHFRHLFDSSRFSSSAMGCSDSMNAVVQRPCDTSTKRAYEAETRAMAKDEDAASSKTMSILHESLLIRLEETSVKL